MTAGPRGLILPAVATLVVVGILAGLGTWQVRRHAWKRELIATVEARTRAPPSPAPSLAAAAAVDPQTLDYAAVTVTGHWLPGIEAHVHAVLGEPRGRFGGPGIWVVAPFERDDGSLIWINRGFAPVERATPAARGDVLDRATVAVAGLLRRSEPRGVMTPVDDIARNLWFVRDPSAFSRGFGLDPDRTAPFTIDAAAALTPPGGLPQAGETRLFFPDDHLGYAATWYGLALAALAIFGLRARAHLAAPERRTGSAAG